MFFSWLQGYQYLTSCCFSFMVPTSTFLSDRAQSLVLFFFSIYTIPLLISSKTITADSSGHIYSLILSSGLPISLSNYLFIFPLECSVFTWLQVSSSSLLPKPAPPAIFPFQLMATPLLQLFISLDSSLFSSFSWRWHSRAWWSHTIKEPACLAGWTTYLWKAAWQERSSKSYKPLYFWISLSQ